MRIANPSGLWTLLALPAIAAMYWNWSRKRTRRVAGLFLWVEVARQAERRVHTQSPIDISVLFDTAAAMLLVALICGLFTQDVEAEGPFVYWLSAAGRLLLCFVIATLLALVWRASPSAAD